MEGDTIIDVRNVAFAYGGSEALKRVDLSVRRGEFMALVGPNGSGKTTLLKIILGALSPRAGAVLLDGRAVRSYPAKERAKRISYVSQQPGAAFPLSVEELVSLGRYPHRERFGQGQEETRAVTDALRLTDALELRERKFSALSGGEKQKILIARAVAQSRHLLLLDEPTLHLDLYYQVQILSALKALCSGGESAVLAVLHDLNLVSLFADKVLLLKSGAPVACGNPRQVLNEETIKEAFGVAVTEARDAQSAALYYLPRMPGPRS